MHPAVRRLSQVTLFLALAVPTARAQVFTVSIKSIDTLMDDAEALIKGALPAEMSEQILPIVNQFRAEQVLHGIDRKRSIGLWANFPENQGDAPTIGVAIPITNLQHMIQSLAEFGFAAEAAGVPGFSHRIALPDGQTSLYVVANNEYAFLTPVPQNAEALKATEPAAWMPRHAESGDISMSMRLQALPAWAKAAVLDSIEQQAAADRQRQPGEPDAAFQSRIAGMDLVINAFKSLLDEGADLSFDIAVDKQKQALVIDYVMSARAGTKFEKTLKAFGARQSLFGPSAATAIASAAMNVPLPDELRKAMETTYEQSRAQAMEQAQAANDAKAAEYAQRTLDILKPAIVTDSIDMRLDLIRAESSTGTQSSYALVGGLRVPNGKDYEKLLRDLSREVKPEDNVEFTLDLAKAADGTAIHRVKPPSGDATLEKIFGNSAIYAAAREDSVLFAFGASGQEALTKALNAAKQPASANNPTAMTVEAHAAGLSQLVALVEPNTGQMLAGVVKQSGAERDAVRITVSAPGGVFRLRLLAEMGALRFLTVLGFQAQGELAAP